MSTRSAPSIRRVGIVFSGGPAPGANAVISAAAVSFIDTGREVVGFFHGYEDLQKYNPLSHRLLPDRHYRVFTERDVGGLRNARGVLIGTARANPGKGIQGPKDLEDPRKTERLRAVWSAMVDLEIDALVSIGGDDTLKTANFLHLFQQSLPPEARRVRVVHLPKTIDNDYRGIDFTFGFFTAVDVMAKELQNLRADAVATRSWFVVETMGRKAGWLSYGVAIAGEANLVVGVEDLDDSLCVPGTFSGPGSGKLDLKRLADRIVDLMRVREERERKEYGTVVLAEGLAEQLPTDYLAGVARDEHGHISLGRMDLGKLVAEVVTERYKQRTGRERKVKGIQLGYESRSAPAHAFDVILGSQLGVGAYRALIEEGLDAHMVSVSGQLDLRYVPFSDLVNPETLLTDVRLVEPGSDFHRLARFLETKMDRLPHWGGEEDDR
jgi:6-phosphofructokinase 1